MWCLFLHRCCRIYICPLGSLSSVRRPPLGGFYSHVTAALTFCILTLPISCHDQRTVLYIQQNGSAAGTVWTSVLFRCQSHELFRSFFIFFKLEPSLNRKVLREKSENPLGPRFKVNARLEQQLFIFTQWTCLQVEEIP